MSVDQRKQVRTALVTGATGFVGSRLACRLVHDQWNVHIVTRAASTLPPDPEFKQVTRHFYDGSLASLSRAMREARPNVVFHLAALFLSDHKAGDVEALISSNVLFGTQLLESMVECGVTSLVNTGTSWQHYRDDSNNSVNLYAATKQAYEDILRFYVDAKGMRAVTLKLFDTYGPRDPRLKLVNQLLKAGLSGKPIPMSPGEQRIHLVHVDDVIEAFILSAALIEQPTANGYASYRVDSGAAITLRELVLCIEEVWGRKVPVVWGGRAYRSREVMVPWPGGERLPSWRNRVPLQEGLKQIIDAMSGS